MRSELDDLLEEQLEAALRCGDRSRIAAIERVLTERREARAAQKRRLADAEIGNGFSDAKWKDTL